MRWVLVVMLLATGCRRANGMPELVSWEDRLRALAGFQLDCDPESLTVLPLGNGHQAGVSGCGQRAVYMYIHDRKSWVRADDASILGR